eukprot:jgi/Hompol1/3285/HPOL_006449-RA
MSGLIADQLDGFLKRLGTHRIHENTQLGKLDLEMAQFLKLGYLERQKMRSVDGDTNKYVWGPRAKVEFSSKEMVDFMLQMYPNAAPAVRKRLALDIERSAGIM